MTAYLRKCRPAGTHGAQQIFHTNASSCQSGKFARRSDGRDAHYQSWLKFRAEQPKQKSRQQENAKLSTCLRQQKQNDWMNQEIMYNSRNTTKAWKLQRKTTKAQQLGATTRGSHRAKAQAPWRRNRRPRAGLSLPSPPIHANPKQPRRRRKRILPERLLVILYTRLMIRGTI